LHTGAHLISQAKQVLRWRGLWFDARLSKNVHRLHLNGKKLGVMAYTCHSSKDRKCKIGGLWSRLAWAKDKTTLFPNKPEQKELEAWLKHGTPCLASIKTWIQTPVSPEKERKRRERERSHLFYHMRIW
jgi:hypothetical protein